MISIIVPIFNAAHYLPACIQSILSQTVSDLELILLDDGSTDQSLAITQSFAKQDKRIIVLTQSHAGQSAARNNGLRHAKGEYIAFVDADDIIENDWCEKHLKAIDKVDYVQSGYVRAEKASLPRNKYQFTSPCMRLYRRDAIQDIRFTEGMIYEDVLFSVDLWLSGATCRMMDYTGYTYTVNPRSTTSRPHPEEQRQVIQALKQRLSTPSLKGKCIVLYTLIRLKFYFLKQ